MSFKNILENILKICNNLKFKGVPEKLINSCWDEIDDKDYHETLRRLWKTYYDKQNGLKEYQKKSKTITYLMGRGYEYEEILGIF